MKPGTDPAQRRFGGGSDLVDPPPGVSYASVLRTEPMTTGAFQALGGVLLAMAGYSLLLPLIAGAILGLTWLGRGRPGTFTEYQTAALGYEHIEGMIASHLAIGSMIVFMMFVVRFVHHKHPKWLASVQPGFRWRYALACGLVALVGLNAIYWASRVGVGFDFAPGPNAVWWLLVIVVLSPLQAAAEEFLFRGYLMQAAGAVGRNPWLAVIASALIFTAMHGNQNAPLLVDRFGFGLLAGALVLFTGGLEAAIAAHVINNIFAFGYATLSGGVAQVRGLAESSWATTGWNLLAYSLVALGCWFIARKMRGATRTPGLAT